MRLPGWGLGNGSILVLDDPKAEHPHGKKNPLIHKFKEDNEWVTGKNFVSLLGSPVSGREFALDFPGRLSRSAGSGSPGPSHRMLFQTIYGTETFWPRASTKVGKTLGDRSFEVDLHSEKRANRCLQLDYPLNFPRSYKSPAYKKGQTSMVISGGLGESDLPLRFNIKPEIVIVTLLPA